ncbi:MAG: MnmC family methyltransferase [Candidatus Woesearchaeota archaeon]
MQKIITKDGSISFMSEEYGEAYHALSGAVEEAIVKFIDPTEIAARALSGSLRVLDIGFGLGYKSLMTIESAKKSNPDCQIDIVTLEKDENILRTKVDVLSGLEKSYKLLRFLVQVSLEKKSIAKKDNVSLTIMFGNAPDRIKELAPGFDIVFLDPFSPKKNPEMWTLQFFQDIFGRMKNGSALATYSCAAIVRKNLSAAGFVVKEVAPFKRRGPSLLALRP